MRDGYVRHLHSLNFNKFQQAGTAHTHRPISNQSLLCFFFLGGGESSAPPAPAARFPLSSKSQFDLICRSVSMFAGAAPIHLSRGKGAAVESQFCTGGGRSRTLVGIRGKKKSTAGRLDVRMWLPAVINSPARLCNRDAAVCRSAARGEAAAGYPGRS